MLGDCSQIWLCPISLIIEHRNTIDGQGRSCVIPSFSHSLRVVRSGHCISHSERKKILGRTMSFLRQRAKEILHSVVRHRLVRWKMRVQDQSRGLEACARERRKKREEKGELDQIGRLVVNVNRNSFRLRRLVNVEFVCLYYLSSCRRVAFRSGTIHA